MSSHKSINYYILVLHLGQQGYLKHIIEMNHLGLRHTKKMKSYFVIKENILVAPGPLAHSLSLYTCIYALYTGEHLLDKPVLMRLSSLAK